MGMHRALLIAALFCGSAVAQQPRTSPPISVGIVFDSSGSMGRKLNLSRQAVAQFFGTTGPQDEFFLIQSSSSPVVASGFTANTDEIRDRLTVMQAKGRSALLDAIYSALFQMKKARNPRKALLVISDGGDNNSRYREGEIKNLVSETGVPIYAIGVYEALALRGRTAEEISGPGLLQGIAEQSGARHFTVESLAELPNVVAQLSTALRTERP